MKYEHNSKMDMPTILHGQPYLQVALVSDMEPSSTSELVSTDQILGVAVPEIFICKWEGCGSHFLTNNDLVKHVNTEHINADSKQMYTCYWKGCVREGKSFDARYKILIHLRTHTGEKPHLCPVTGCQASFSRIENLKIHVRTHTGTYCFVFLIKHLKFCRIWTPFDGYLEDFCESHKISRFWF